MVYHVWEGKQDTLKSEDKLRDDDDDDDDDDVNSDDDGDDDVKTESTRSSSNKWTKILYQDYKHRNAVNIFSKKNLATPNVKTTVELRKKHLKVLVK